MVWGLIAVLLYNLAWSVSASFGALATRAMFLTGFDQRLAISFNYQIAGVVLGILSRCVHIGFFLLLVRFAVRRGLIEWLASEPWYASATRRMYLVVAVVIAVFIAWYWTYPFNQLPRGIDRAYGFWFTVYFYDAQNWVSLGWALAFPLAVCVLLRRAFRFAAAVDVFDPEPEPAGLLSAPPSSSSSPLVETNQNGRPPCTA